MIIRCLAKVSDSYKLDKRTKRTFRDTGAIAYDNRILSYDTSKKRPGRRVVSIWTIEGRQKIPYVGGTHNEQLLQYQKGESDLLYTNRGAGPGKWFLLATCELPDEDTAGRPRETPEDILGVDLGIVDLATDSDGEHFTGGVIRKYRKKRAAIRVSLQAKKEQTTSTLINHTISKRLVDKAKETHRAIALEDLKRFPAGTIRQRTNQRLSKSQKREHNTGPPGGWPFNQFRTFISYKAQKAGCFSRGIVTANRVS